MLLGMFSAKCSSLDLGRDTFTKPLSGLSQGLGRVKEQVSEVFRKQAHNFTDWRSKVIRVCIVFLSEAMHA